MGLLKTHKQLTLRQLISLVKSTPGWEEKMFRHLFNRDQRMFPKGKLVSVERTRGAYSHVMNELLDKPKAKSFKYPICVKTTVDPFDKRKFTDVCLINPKYVAPAPGLKPWGGKPPKGHYNLNLNKHNQWFAFGWTTWSKLIDTKIVIQTEKPLPLWQVLSYILWDLTFDGWTEKQVAKNEKIIMKQLAKSMKQIKEGKCTRIPKKDDESFSLVIPDCVKKQIKDISQYEKESQKSKV